MEDKTDLKVQEVGTARFEHIFRSRPWQILCHKCNQECKLTGKGSVDEYHHMYENSVLNIDQKLRLDHKLKKMF